MRPSIAPSRTRCPGYEEGIEDNADLWAPADESRASILDFERRAWAHADATIVELSLDSIGHVPWWPEDRNEVTLHRILVHMVAEADRHAGHADIVRELIDGATGLRSDSSNLPDGNELWWSGYRARLEASASSLRSD